MHTHRVVSHCVILFEKGFGALGTEKHVKLSGFKKAESSDFRNNVKKIENKLENNMAGS